MKKIIFGIALVFIVGCQTGTPVDPTAQQGQTPAQNKPGKPYIQGQNGTYDLACLGEIGAQLRAGTTTIEQCAVDLKQAKSRADGGRNLYWNGFAWIFPAYYYYSPYYSTSDYSFCTAVFGSSYSTGCSSLFGTSSYYNYYYNSYANYYASYYSKCGTYLGYWYSTSSYYTIPSYCYYSSGY